MARITIDVPDELRTNIKMLAAKEGKTMADLLTPILERFVSNRFKEHAKTITKN